LEATDRELVRQCRKGDAAAWESIVRRHQTRIYNVVYRLTGRFDLAEDLTQEIFLKIWRNLGRYRPELGTFPTWSLRLARNHVIDHHRRHGIEAARTDSVDERSDRGMEFASAAADPGESLEREERRRMVHRLLLRVPELYREAVVLRDLEELSYEEMVRVLGVPIGTVKSRINRGRIELAKLIRRREPGRA
jgi:RNA polymerase sigma-70 factor (ECF subfamily)